MSATSREKIKSEGEEEEEGGGENSLKASAWTICNRGCPFYKNPYITHPGA